jgi:hypothetical protein
MAGAGQLVRDAAGLPDRPNGRSGLGATRAIGLGVRCVERIAERIGLGPDIARLTAGGVRLPRRVATRPRHSPGSSGFGAAGRVAG